MSTRSSRVNLAKATSMTLSGTIKSRKNSNASLEQPDYLKTVVATKQYTASSALEISLKENDVLHVLEEKDNFYYCYSPANQQEGYVPKNYTQSQKPLCVLPAVLIHDIDYDDNQFFEGERLILLAKINETEVYYRKMTRDQHFGKIVLSSLYLEGDFSTLPSYLEYEQRKTSFIRSGASTPDQRSRANSKSSRINADKEEKVIEKLKSNINRSSSYGSLLQNLFPRKY